MDTDMKSAPPKHLQIKNLTQGQQKSLQDLVQFLNSATSSKAVIEAIEYYRYFVEKTRSLEREDDRLADQLNHIKYQVKEYFYQKDQLRSLAEEKS